jgi:hypothetical protein
VDTVNLDKKSGGNISGARAGVGTMTSRVLSNRLTK